MSLAPHDLLGAAGVALVLWAYLALQLGRWRAEQLRYSVVNGLGALLIVVSLCFAFNLAAFLVEAFWVLISLVGIARWVRARRFPVSSRPG